MKTPDDGETARAARIRESLTAALSPTHLEVIDESALHHGHAGWSPAGETHFRVKISAPTLDGQSRVERHRSVNRALKQEFDAGLHALAIEVQPSG